MAHLLRQIYVDEIDFEAVTIEKIVDLVFTEMIMIKCNNLKKRNSQNKTKLMVIIGQSLKCSEVLDHEERWITYHDRLCCY